LEHLRLVIVETTKNSCAVESCLPSYHDEWIMFSVTTWCAGPYVSAAW